MRFTFNKKSAIWISLLAVVVVLNIIGLLYVLRSKPVPSQFGSVVSNGIGCAEMGTKILSRGGSAVDAFITVAFCEVVMVPQSMGLGGGFVATLYNKEKKLVETILAREIAPAAATTDLFVGQPGVTGIKSVAVPGELLGYWKLWEKYGKLKWAYLIEPVIKLAANGFVVSEHLANAIVNSQKLLAADPELAKLFLDNDLNPLPANSIIVNTKLAETLKVIAEKGADAIYGQDNPIGQNLVKDIQAQGGIITLDDLRNFQVRFEESSTNTTFAKGEYTLHTTPLPTSGPVLKFMVDVMEKLYIDADCTYWQRVVETFKHAYAQRTKLGDWHVEPEYFDSINETMTNMSDEHFLERIRSLIHDDRTSQDYSYYGADYATVNDHGTANMAVLAPNGDAITVTSTINSYFGAVKYSPSTGIILNNEMDDFSTPGVINSYGVPASPANFIRPGKSPLSSMCPAIIIDKFGDAKLLIGAAGGTKITTSVFITMALYLQRGYNLQDAISQGRLHHQLAPMHISYDPHVDASLLKCLATKGHKEVELPKGTGFAAVTAISSISGRPNPQFDVRRLGSTSIVNM